MLEDKRWGERQGDIDSRCRCSVFIGIAKLRRRLKFPGLTRNGGDNDGNLYLRATCTGTAY